MIEVGVTEAAVDVRGKGGRVCIGGGAVSMEGTVIGADVVIGTGVEKAAVVLTVRD